MRRKRLALLLAVGMAVGSLAGCGQTSPGGGESVKREESNEGQEPEESQGTDTSDEGEGVDGTTDVNDPYGRYEDEITLTVACSSASLTFDSTQDGYASMEDNVWTRAYQEKLGIHLDYIWTAPDDEYITKWNVSITAGDIPDVAIVPESIYSQLLEGGYVEDMTEYYEQYASETYKAAVEADGGVCEGYVTRDGRLMGLPHPGATPDNLEFLYIRKDWLDELDLPVPKTVDELLDTARAFQEAKLGGENTVGMLASGELRKISLGDLRGIMEAYGVYNRIWVEGEDGKLVYGNVQPEMKEALQKLQDMYKEGLIPRDFAAADWDTLVAQLTSGQCGIAYGAYWVFTNLFNAETMEIDDWIVAEGVTADGSPYVSGAEAAPGHYVFVKKGIEHPEAVVKLINLQFDLLNGAPRVYDGYEYEKEDGTLTSISAIYYCIAPYLRAPWKNATNARLIIEALETGDESKVLGTGLEQTYLEAKEVVKNGSKDTKYAFAYGIFGPGGIYDIVDTMWKEGRIYVDKFNSAYSDFALQNMSNMREVLDAEYVKIIMGDDIDNFDKAVETWYKTGGERITQEVNEWYEMTK